MAFAVGDKVRVKSGKEHMPDHAGVVLQVAEVKGDTYALRMPDGTVHRWYTGDELAAARTDARERVLRIDRGGTLRPPREDARGFLEIDGHATRVGVLEYTDPSFPGGIRRELRLREDLAAPESLASYRNAPITDDHPSEMVTAANSMRFARGMVTEPGRMDDEHVAIRGLVTDASLIGKMRNDGKRELSPGYTVELDTTPGIHPVYGRYDVRQTKILVNHLAVVERARAGSTAAVRMDGAVVPTASLNSCVSSNAHQVHAMDPKELQAKLDQAATLLAQEKARADAAEQKLDGEKKRADTAEGKVAALNAEVTQLRGERRDDAAIAAQNEKIKELTERADAAEKKLAGFDERVAAGVKARAKLERDAASVLGPKARFDDLSNREIMIQVLTKRGYEFDVNRSDEALKGAFDIAVEGWANCGAALDRIGQVTAEKTRQDAATGGGENKTAAQARAEMKARLDTAHLPQAGAN